MHPSDLTLLESFVADWVDAMERLDWAMWPTGQCGIASLLLVPTLRVAWPAHDWYVTVGTWSPPSMGDDRRAHCWASTGDIDVVVDPTVRQFGDDYKLVSELGTIGWSRYKPALAMTPPLEERAIKSIRAERRDLGLCTGSIIKDLFQSLGVMAGSS